MEEVIEHLIKRYGPLTAKEIQILLAKKYRITLTEEETEEYIKKIPGICEGARKNLCKTWRYSDSEL